jgi:hypothetical protein
VKNSIIILKAGCRENLAKWLEAGSLGLIQVNHLRKFMQNG